MEITEKIRDLIKKNMNIEKGNSDFSDEDNIFQLGFVNSLFAMKLVTLIESEFDIEIDNNDLDIKNFCSVKNMITFLQNKNLI